MVKNYITRYFYFSYNILIMVEYYTRKAGDISAQEFFPKNKKMSEMNLIKNKIYAKNYR